MNHRLLILCVAAMPVFAQAPTGVWVNLAPPVAQEVAPSGHGSLVISSRQADLGVVDGDRPILGQITIENRGSTPFSVTVPAGMAASMVRVQFPRSTSLTIPQGGRVDLPVEYDARLNDGPSTFVVALDTDDPAAPQLRQAFTAVVTHQVVVSPHRDLIAAAETPVRFFFAPKDGSKFLTASLEDPEAPIALVGTQDAGTGRLDGVATLDAAKAASAPAQGAVRVVGKTDKGTTAYFWLQWSLQK